MRIERELFAEAETLSQRVCAALIARLARARAARGRAALLVPTGATPERTYALLAEAGARGEVDFTGVDLFALDEYEGGRDFRDYFEDRLLRRLPAANRPVLHALNGLAADPRAEAAAYEQEIAAAGGIDLCLLGVGVEGHIGFNEAGSAFGSRTRRVALAPSTLEANRNAMKAPYTHALTVGLATIAASRAVFVMAAGRRKAPAIRRFFTEPPSPALPLSVLRGHPDLTFFLDREAALETPPF